MSFYIELRELHKAKENLQKQALNLTDTIKPKKV